MKKYNHELNYVRAILCAIIVITHILTEYTNANNTDVAQLETLYWVRMFLIFGTAGFLMLTQLIFTLNLQELPKDYIKRRIQYVFIPYVLMGSFYTYSEAVYLRTPFITGFIENVLKGQWYGYFIFIILKFFVLNTLIVKLWPKLLSSSIAVVIAIIFNIFYLYMYHHYDALSQWVEDMYFFEPNTVIFGWIGYYFVGSYIGSHYDKIKGYLEQYGLILIFAVTVSYVLFIIFGSHNYSDVSSFNEYILLYSIIAFLYVIHVSIKSEGIMVEVVSLISMYSFFIYLFHPNVIQYIYNYTERFEDSTFLFILTSVVLTFSVCIGLGSILRSFKIFKYIMGTQPYK
ncbi:acyltransferase family protein [Phocicoccus pinnipedialis]|uniref:Putative poly-beta-1,6-N-acetyl-D-glucosamine export protein n=1 Tax=Phocicoccus pinnipedialis TaxID=110845 RepID=A0A6V7RMR8_9BACL|nr:acyltransferase family protein [Jeotgalicoccus pinnipedialis]MBP1940230.1 membrane-bound acyltransferase YfiQ involved in biofilm formation [Jeotgalicoccus pinnipedialis]CAD2079593.1 putative poly-beta-1,6-N-acetyl-D-glucosamine export protein [Jeotgalicoccus pinnipedialis]